EAQQAKGGPPRRLVGLRIEWDGIEKAFAAQGLPPAVSATASREAVPLYAGGKQAGRVTSHTWSPTLKQMIGLGSVRAASAAALAKTVQPFPPPATSIRPSDSRAAVWPLRSVDMLAVGAQVPEAGS